MNDDGTVGTIWGPFDRKRAEALRECLREADERKLVETRFEGKGLHVQFGKYLLEYLDMTMRDRR